MNVHLCSDAQMDINNMASYKSEAQRRELRARYGQGYADAVGRVKAHINAHAHFFKGVHVVPSIGVHNDVMEAFFELSNAKFAIIFSATTSGDNKSTRVVTNCTVDEHAAEAIADYYVECMHGYFDFEMI